MKATVKGNFKDAPQTDLKLNQFVAPMLTEEVEANSKGAHSKEYREIDELGTESFQTGMSREKQSSKLCDKIIQAF